MYSSNTEKSKTDTGKRPFKNLVRILANGNFSEIPKIIRRRSINSLRFLRRIVILAINPVYNYPIVAKRRHRRQLRRILYRYFAYKPSSVVDLKKIALIVEDGTSYPKSSSFIRLISPLTETCISETMDIELFDADSVVLQEDTSICIVQRTAFTNERSAQDLVTNLRTKNIPLIVDTDDAFSLIDSQHPEYQIHQGRIKAKEFLIQNADQVWVSTEQLQKFYKPINSNTVVVANGLDRRLWQKPAKKILPANKKIQMLYMGTATHDADFKVILSALESLAQTYRDSFELTVIGAVTELPERDWIHRQYQPRSIYPKFVEWFLKQGPFDIGLSPLVDSEFNRSKSDIKCLDYLAASIMPVVSDTLPYQNPALNDFVIKVENDTEVWEKQLANILQDPEAFRRQKNQVISKAQTYIWQERNSVLTAELIKKLLDQLLARST